MKILHVLAQLPHDTGSGVYFCNLIDRLKEYGHEQRAVYARQGEDRFTGLGCGQCNPVAFQSEVLPFPVVGMSDEMPYPSTQYGKMDEEMIKAWQGAFRQKLLAERETFAPDAVVLHHLWMLSSMGAEIFTESFTLGVCHNTDLRQAQKHPHLREKYVTALSGLGAVAVLSGRQKPLVEALYGLPQAKMAVVGGGFDERLFFPGAAPKPKKLVEVVFAGKVASSKGVFELVRAFRLAQKEGPEMRLWVVGNASAENEQKLAALICGQESIRRSPALPQAELAQRFREMDVFVLPSYYEGIALSAIEALACGMWCVTSEISDLRALLGEAVNHSGGIEYVKLPRLVDTDKPVAQDVEGYVEALRQKLLVQVEKVARGDAFPDGVAETMESHSWKGVAGRFEAVLQRGHGAAGPGFGE